jgi:uncharacterized protein
LTSKQILVLYHANCLDGFGAAYAAWRKFGDSADYLPVNYGEAPPKVKGKEVFILDFSYKRDVLLKLAEEAITLRVIDHHKTAAEDIDGLPFAKFDMEKSGCVLAWEHFHKTVAPDLLQHIQDRDLWIFNYSDTKAICEALRNTVPFDFDAWHHIVTHIGEDRLADIGNTLLRVFNNDVENLLPFEHSVSLFGSHGLACNAPPKYASELGNRLALRSGTFGLVYFYAGPTNKSPGEWRCSLRSVGDYDVSVIAKKFGGGGHKNAAGFSILRLEDAIDA